VKKSWTLKYMTWIKEKVHFGQPALEATLPGDRGPNGSPVQDGAKGGVEHDRTRGNGRPGVPVWRRCEKPISNVEGTGKRIL